MCVGGNLDLELDQELHAVLSFLRDAVEWRLDSASGDRGRDADLLRRYVDRACDDGLANDARDDVRLRQHQEVRGAFDLGDRGAGAVVGERWSSGATG